MTLGTHQVRRWLGHTGCLYVMGKRRNSMAEISFPSRDGWCCKFTSPCKPCQLHRTDRRLAEWYSTKQLSLNECFSLSSHPWRSSGEEMKRKFLSKQNVDVGWQQTYPLYIWQLQLTWHLSDNSITIKTFGAQAVGNMGNNKAWRTRLLRGVSTMPTPCSPRIC